MKTDYHIIKSVLGEDDMERIFCLWLTVDESQWDVEKAATIFGSPSKTFLGSIRNMYINIELAYADEMKVYSDYRARVSSHLNHLESKRGDFAEWRREKSFGSCSKTHADETADEQVKDTDRQLVMRTDDAGSRNRKRMSAQSDMEEHVEKSTFKRSRRMIAASNVSM